MEQHLPKAVWASKSIPTKDASVRFLIKWAAIPRNQCVRCLIRSRSSAGEEWIVIPKEWGTQQLSTTTIAVASRSLTSIEKCYNNNKRKAVGILHDLEKFNYYCFSHKVSLITYHKPLVAILNKDIATLLHKLQRILLCIHQYITRILYKPEPHLFIANPEKP